MSWLPDPEKIVKNLIAGLGVDPADFGAFITMARNEFLEMRADRLAFKPASVKAYQEITQRLDRMDAQLDLLLMKRESGAFREAHPNLLNGNADVRSD